MSDINEIEEGTVLKETPVTVTIEKSTYDELQNSKNELDKVVVKFNKLFNLYAELLNKYIQGE